MIVNNSKVKEENNMLAHRKPNQAAAISKGMTKAFINELAKNKINDSYWGECAKAKKPISSYAMEQMKKMCNGDD